MSWNFLVDEDMPRSSAVILRQAGYQADDVRDVGLRGQSDAKVFAYAQVRKSVLISCDKGFTNLLKFPLGSHAGIIVVRVADELPTERLNHELLQTLTDLKGESLAGVLVIVEVGRSRIRRP